MAVRVLAQRRALNEVKRQFRAQGLKISNMTHKEIVMAAEKHLAELARVDQRLETNR